jgi:hypothetical protein
VKKLRLLAIAFLALALSTSSGLALQYEKIALGNTSKILLIARGHISNGDTQRLLGFLLALPPSDRVAAMIVDSPGGGLVEAESLAGVIRRAAFPLFVPSGGQCSSACFLLFAAAPNRFVAADALIGVHRANESGKETIAAKTATAAMIKDAMELGVPEQVIMKLAQTPANQKSWLSQSDFAAMRVSIVARGPRTAGFTEVGVVDRQQIEAWLALLTNR